MRSETKNEEVLAERIKRGRGSVHPVELTNAKPDTSDAIPINEENTRNQYGRLTDDSPYHHYAWEFFRRNRFYRKIIDFGKSDFNECDEKWWPYRIIATSETSPEWAPLYPLKTYTQDCNTGAQAKWLCIHNFINDVNFPKQRFYRSSYKKLQSQDQIGITFDVSSGQGGISVINQQIEMARAILYQVEELRGVNSKRHKQPLKRRLRAQLRAADLLSHPPVLSIAHDFDRGRRKSAKVLVSQFEPDDNRQPDIRELARILPLYDLLPTLEINSTTIEDSQLEKRASELITIAWQNIYQLHCLNWLSYDLEVWVKLAVAISSNRMNQKNL